MYNVTDEVPENTRTAIHSCDGEINMNDLIAREANILFVVLDSLRFDIAFQEQEAGNTPNINRYGRWGNDSNLLIVFYVQIMPDDFVMQLHRF